MRNRRLFVKVFILTSLFWLAVDILYVLSSMNSQMNFFDTDSFVPLDATGSAHVKRSRDGAKQRKWSLKSGPSLLKSFKGWEMTANRRLYHLDLRMKQNVYLIIIHLM